MELSKKEWEMLRVIAVNLLITGMTEDGITRVCDTLISEEVELLKKDSKMRSIESIIGKSEARNLKKDFNDALDSGASYGDVEDLLLGYGLEMDYLEALLW